jgi:hypothetical protein
MPTKHSRIRTLTQFTTLEHFSTVMFAITNNGSRIQEILPGSLIELELSDTSMETDRDEVNDILWGLSDAKLKRLPNLSRFALTLDDWNHSYVKFEKRSMNGVEFCFDSPKGCLIEASDYELFMKPFETCPSTPTSDTLPDTLHDESY